MAAGGPMSGPRVVVIGSLWDRIVALFTRPAVVEVAPERVNWLQETNTPRTMTGMTPYIQANIIEHKKNMEHILLTGVQI